MLLFIEGFDHVGGDRTVLGKKWDAVGATMSATARTGAFAGVADGAEPLTKVIPVPGTAFILGCALRWGNLPNSDILLFAEGGTTHITLNVDATGTVVIKRGSTVLATATAPSFVVNGWYYVEIKVVIHDTAGSVVVHVDGTPLTFSASLTGIDTRNGGTGVVDRFTFSGNFNPPYTLVDDLYLCDTTGTTNNDFLGICTVETLLPATGNGDLTDFTPSAGTDHGALVRENPPDDDTTYVTSLTVGQQDCYHYPALALTGAILGIQTDLYAKKTDAGARTVAGVLRVGTTNYPGVAVIPPTSYRYLPEVRETNPATGVAWTSADVNALQVGMKIVS